MYHRSIVTARADREHRGYIISKKQAVDKEDCADAMVATMCCLAIMTSQTMSSRLIQPTPAIQLTEIKPLGYDPLPLSTPGRD